MKKRILCFGDSNTWGFIPGSGFRYDENTRWTQLLQAKLKDDYVVLEEGLNGRTSSFDVGYDEFLNGKKSFPFVLKTAFPLDLIIIFLGTNDIVEHDEIQTEKGITEIVRMAKNANYIIRSSHPIFPNGSKVLLITPTRCIPSPIMTQTIVERSEHFSQMCKRISELMDVENLEFSSKVLPSEVDGVHFSPEAHKIIAEEIYSKIKEMNI